MELKKATKTALETESWKAYWMELPMACGRARKMEMSMEISKACPMALERASLKVLVRGSQTALTTVTLMAREMATWKGLERA